MSPFRRVILSVAILGGIAGVYCLGRYSSPLRSVSSSQRHPLYYVDPMHPAYKSDKPGTAPDCGMALEPIFAENVANTPFSSSMVPLASGAVNIDSATQQLLGIRLATVEKSKAARAIHVVGRVLPEDNRVYKINSGVDGYIRETYKDSVGTRVKKDEKLASYYSPEFLSVASGFLAASERVPGSVGNDGAKTVPFPGTLAKQGTSSVQGYIDRLRNLGMSDVQIKHVAEARQLPEHIDVVAPVDGFILSRNVSPGQHFDHDMEFYRIADLSRVWVVAEVDAQEASLLRPGGAAKITFGDTGRAFSARVSDSLPQSEAGGGTVKLRLEMENARLQLRPDMLVDVELPVSLGSAITVPLDALVDSGTHARVYVEHGAGVFEPREVETGWRSGEQVEIRKGVKPGERVVVAATFLVDSESRLKSPGFMPLPASPAEKPAKTPEHTVAAKMETDPSCGMPVDPAKATAAGNSLETGGSTHYFCSKQCRDKYQNSLVAKYTKQASGR